MSTASVWRERAATTGRIGLVARGVMYCLAGMIAVLIATRRAQAEVEETGAVQALAGQPYGKPLLVALAVGFAGYAAWRLLRAAIGAEEGGDRQGWTGRAKRLGDFVEGVVYITLLLATIRVLQQGSAESDSDTHAQTLSARLLEHGWGRVLVVVVGLAFVAGGAVLAWSALHRRFEEHLRSSEMQPWQRRWLPRLGMAGHTARAAVAALIGLFLVQAAVDHDPSKAVGIDGALHRLADRPYGPWALGLVALGLVGYGLYSFVEAQWRMVLED